MLTAHQSTQLRLPNHCFQYSFGSAKCLGFCRHLCYSPVPGCLGDIWHGASWKEKDTNFLINSNSLSNGRRVKGGQAVKCKSFLGNHKNKLLQVLLSVWGVLSCPSACPQHTHPTAPPQTTPLHSTPLFVLLSSIPAGFIPRNLMLWLNHDDCMG